MRQPIRFLRLLAAVGIAPLRHKPFRGDRGDVSDELFIDGLNLPSTEHRVSVMFRDDR